MKCLLAFAALFLCVHHHHSVDAVAIPEEYYPPPSQASAAGGRVTERPGWIRRALLKVGQMASSATNAVGSGTMKLNNWIERVCQVMKMVMPVVAAVCQAGQFKFCPAADAPGELPAAISQRSIDFDAVDK